MYKRVGALSITYKGGGRETASTIKVISILGLAITTPALILASEKLGQGVTVERRNNYKQEASRIVHRCKTQVKDKAQVESRERWTSEGGKHRMGDI